MRPDDPQLFPWRGLAVVVGLLLFLVAVGAAVEGVEAGCW